MPERTVDLIEAEIKEINDKINDHKSTIREKRKERRLLLREERDQLRYIAGGVIFDHLKEMEESYPGILQKVYDLCDTRDQIKFVRADYIKGNIEELKNKNVQECKESIKNITEKVNLEDLSEEDKKKLDIILAAFADESKNLKRALYSKEGEIRVYIDRGKEEFISDKLAVYLRDQENFSC